MLGVFLSWRRMLINGEFVAIFSIPKTSGLVFTNRFTLSTILSAIENYIKNAAEDVRDVRQIVNENGKRLREYSERSCQYQEEITSWHRIHGERVGALNAAIETHGTVTKRICVDIEHLRKEADETKTSKQFFIDLT